MNKIINSIILTYGFPYGPNHHQCHIEGWVRAVNDVREFLRKEWESGFVRFKKATHSTILTDHDIFIPVEQIIRVSVLKLDVTNGFMLPNGQKLPAEFFEKIENELITVKDS
jgi:hypothetical protein